MKMICVIIINSWLYFGCACLLTHLATSYISRASACTSAYHPPSHIMLKSYDWHDGEGDLYFNPKGINRQAFPHEQSSTRQPHSWRSQLASLSFNQYGRGFPNGGINEAGLAIEVLWLEQSQASPADDRPYLNELEWVQLALDTQRSVSGLIQLMSEVRISPIHGKVHYMSCDSSGQCVTLEVIEGQLVIHTQQNLPYPALTNHTYRDALKYLKHLKTTPQEATGSLNRFAVAAQAIQEPKKVSLLEALNSLNKVEIKGYTKWKIAYDLNNLTVIFRTDTHQRVRRVSLRQLIQALQTKEGCAAQSTLSLSSKVKGDLSLHFMPPKLAEEKRNLRARFKRLKLSKDLAYMLAQHGAKCRGQ